VKRFATLSVGASSCSSARLCDIEQTDEQELVPTESPAS